MKSMLRFSLAGLFLALFSATPVLRGQSVAVAQVSGIVMDSTGKSIAGAQVTMTETDKGVTRTTVSDGGGSYTFPILRWVLTAWK